MSTQRYISTSFWDDAWIQELSAEAKLLYMYLLTCPLANIAGVYKITARRISFDTGISTDQATKILGEFEAKGKAAFVDEYIILPNWPKYQKTSSKDTKAGIDRVLADLPEEVLLALKRLNYQYPDIPTRPPVGPHKAPPRPPVGPQGSARPTLNSYSSLIPTPIPSGGAAAREDLPVDKSEEPELYAFALARVHARKRKADDPELMARKIMYEPDVVADFLKAKEAAANAPPPLPAPPPCPGCGKAPTIQTPEPGKPREAICFECRRSWTYDEEFTAWVPGESLQATTAG